VSRRERRVTCRSHVHNPWSGKPGVLVLCFGEFGRRAADNGSGTDGPVVLAGPEVQTGMVGESPKLLDLQDGDLKMSVDFRRVYATVLEDWLGLASKPALGADFDKLPLFRS
jgi:uncharacterized protein (DUF1501 family)